MRQLILILALLLSSQPASAWAEKGHRIIAAIAWELLSPSTRAQIDTLLQSDRSNLTATDFVSAATWADAYRDSDRGGSRARYEQTRRWHYINLKLGNPDFAHACFESPPLAPHHSAGDGPAKACISDKVEQFAAELAAPTSSARERLRALQFLIHLVGDLHQPLHAIDNDDNGGNDIFVSAGKFERGTLHSYWDNIPVNSLGRDVNSVARHLVAAADKGQLDRWRSGSPRDWTLETYAVARNIAYEKLPASGGDNIHELDANYEREAKAAAKQQLIKAGVRLAVLLEQSFSGGYRRN